MARLARIAIPDVPHHVNQRQTMFFGDEDYPACREMMAAACRSRGVRCLA